MRTQLIPCLAFFFLFCPLNDKPYLYQPSYLLFSKRLTRFPDAWLLPLFPLLLRILLQIFRGGYSEEKSENTNMKRRLYLYILLIQLRGWILYKLFDTVEDMIVASGGTDCWYSELLMFHDSECRGREMDFSDHVVLYYAQIIPIALTEFLHSFSVPYWRIKNTLRDDDTTFPKLIPIRASTAPPRPLTEIEEFRRSSDFLLLENTVMMSDHLK